MKLPCYYCGSEDDSRSSITFSLGDTDLIDPCMMCLVNLIKWGFNQMELRNRDRINLVGDEEIVSLTNKGNAFLESMIGKTDAERIEMIKEHHKDQKLPVSPEEMLEVYKVLYGLFKV